jgi:hypothetical protein
MWNVRMCKGKACNGCKVTWARMPAEDKRIVGCKKVISGNDYCKKKDTRAFRIIICASACVSF